MPLLSYDLEKGAYSTLIRFGAENDPLKAGLGVIIDPSPEAWQQQSTTLTPPEYEQFLRLKTEEARNSFCFGRSAVRSAVARLTGTSKPDFTVEHGIFGFPVLEPNPGGLCLSIAHTSSSGMALCFPEKLLMGADMEKIATANSATMLSSFTSQEKRMRLNGIEDVLLHHLLWSAREALSKALRTGFLIPLSMLEVRSVTTQNGWYQLEFVNFSLLTAIAFKVSHYLLAIVFPKKLPLDITFMHDLVFQYNEEY